MEPPSATSCFFNGTFLRCVTKVPDFPFRIVRCYLNMDMRFQST